jgi:hypothetical protein
VRLLTLLSDFGARSPYPAAMRAVVAARVDACFVDISHDVRRHDIREGAFLLASIAPLCPAGTVHLAVVDPGVGTARRPLAVGAGGQFFVGPDNGLLLPAARRLGDVRAYHLGPPAVPPAPSATFHGRDLFAPAAARLLGGEPLERLGRLINDPVELRWAPGSWRGSMLSGQVLYVDPFGNLVTNIPSGLLRPGAALTLRTARGGRSVRVCATYGAGARGELLLVPGSEGLVEIAVREGSAAAHTGLRGGSAVRLRRRPAPRTRDGSRAAGKGA